MKRPTRFIMLPLLALLWSSLAAATPVPEKLVYDVKWSGIKAGSAVQEVTDQDGELHIVYSVRSSGLVNSFFAIDDRSESVLTRGRGSEPFGAPRLFREKINEGKTHTWKEAQFDPVKGEVATTDLLKKTEKSDPISTRTYDTLSSIYYLRHHSRLFAGEPLTLDIFDCKRVWNAEMRVVKREEIGTPVGRFKTVVVKSRLSAPGTQPRNDYMTVWFSDDQLRVPVKLVVKLKVGEFVATLVGGSYWKS